MAERHFLFVQTPFGSFPRRLAKRLRDDGHRVTRVIFNGGDLCSWGFAQAHFFLAPTGRYRDWIARLLRRQAVTDVVTYGDGHYYTEVAIEEAAKLGIATACLEQGYLRPNWITLEPSGVNGSSSLPRDPAVYMQLGESLDELPGAHEAMGTITRNNTLNILRYSLLFYFLAPLFPFYRSPVYMPGYVTGLAHLWRYYYGKTLTEKLEREVQAIFDLEQPYYLALTQRPGDSQLLRHSRFPQVRDFYRYTIDSFAKHADPTHHLVFKCHPLDQGLSGHPRGIREAARKAGVTDRVHFIDGGPLAELVKQSAGVITVNSTAGLAALNFGAKCINLGRAVYGIPGLTFQGELADFWASEEVPDEVLYLRFRSLMAEMTQVLGSYATEKGIAYAVETCATRLTEGLPTVESIAARRVAVTA